MAGRWSGMFNHNSEKEKQYIILGGMFTFFVIYTLLEATVDVKPAGIENVEVGFSTLNGWFSNLVGYKEFWYYFTEVLGVIALLPVILFALLGAAQLARSGSLLKVDRDILALGAVYILMVVLWVIFDYVFILHYRPVTLGYSEASYPSSHTMLAVCVMGTAVMQFTWRVKNEKVLRILKIVCLSLGTLIVLGRTLSGVHWLTDVFAGLILSAILVYLYYLLAGRKFRFYI